MKIPYNVRPSRFLEPCVKVIEANRGKLARGSYVVINIDADADGYPGTFKVTIDPHDRTKFEADPDISHPSRFGARLKAAATALRECGFSGDFDIWHQAGTIRIRKA